MAPLVRSRTWRVRAPAKINLSLRILGLHVDGYHELRTTFQSLALHDTLTLRSVPGPLTLTCDDPRCPLDDSNLVWRAADRLWHADGRRGRPSGVHIAIDKRIPMQAGLGGGSSDAAAALRGLAKLWGTQVPEGRLRAIARVLGADVSFFLDGGSVLGAGRGEILYPLVDRPPAFVVLVEPGFGVSTRDAYGWWDEAQGPALTRPGGGLVAAAPAPWQPGGERGNDLEGPVVAHHPVIGKIVKRLRALGAEQAAMSGSGSVVFGLFLGENAAIDAADGVAGHGRRVTVTRTVDRGEFGRLVRPN